jgi:hypothetical protein
MVQRSSWIWSEGRSGHVFMTTAAGDRAMGPHRPGVPRPACRTGTDGRTPFIPKSRFTFDNLRLSTSGGYAAEWQFSTINDNPGSVVRRYRQHRRMRQEIVPHGSAPNVLCPMLAIEKRVCAGQDPQVSRDGGSGAGFALRRRHTDLQGRRLHGGAAAAARRRGLGCGPGGPSGVSVGSSVIAGPAFDIDNAVDQMGSDRIMCPLPDHSAELVLLIARHSMNFSKAVSVYDDVGRELGADGKAVVGCGLREECAAAASRIIAVGP